MINNETSVPTGEKDVKPLVDRLEGLNGPPDPTSVKADSDSHVAPPTEKDVTPPVDSLQGLNAPSDSAFVAGSDTHGPIPHEKDVTPPADALQSLDASNPTFVKADSDTHLPSPPNQPPFSAADTLHVDENHSAAQPPTGVGNKPNASQIELSAIRVGDTYDGHVVDFIYGSGAQYLVYESDSRLLYEARDKIAFKQLARDRADHLMATSELELKGAYSVTVKKLMGMALVSAFSANTEESANSAFDAVSAFIDGNKPVLDVFGRTRAYIVYLDRRGEIVADFMKLEDRFVPLISEFERLKQSATNNLSSPAVSAAKNMLGYELASALLVSTPPTPAEAFSASHRFIAERVGADVSNRYAYTTLSAAVILGLSLIVTIVFPMRWLAADARMLSLGALAGMVGACISVLQRNDSLASIQFPSQQQIVVQAIVRIILGMVFGTLVVIAAKGNVAFGTFKEVRALFIVSVAAGFSERLIPDLLTKLGKTSAEAAAANPATPAGAPPKK